MFWQQMVNSISLGAMYSLLAMNRQSLKAMFEDGSLPLDYVKSHHPIWHEKLPGKRAELTTTEKVEPSISEEEITTS